jgi:dihydroorotate dehydrogenase electron transfer subunit
MLEDAVILVNETLRGDYRRIRLQAPGICPEVRPGQFVHVRVTARNDRVLRRPFSVCDVDDTGILTIVYKVVGGGTELLADTPPGATCSLLGPLGTPFTVPSAGEVPVIVAGGYGSAATWLLARRSPTPPLLLLGARTDGDLLLTDDFADLGCEVRTATEDGSEGRRGRVTDLLAEVLATAAPAALRVYGCGPHGMIMAVARMLRDHGLDGELSLDHRMCCGIGACYACVVKVRDDSPDGWRYARTCKEGPVFPASRIHAPD